MLPRPVYMDNHATTRVDPRVVEAMLPFFDRVYGNAGSSGHAFGREAKLAVDAARESIAAAIGARPGELVFTSGATESNNLAIRGIAERRRQEGGHFVTAATEHRSVLDPLDRLRRRGFEVTCLSVAPAGSDRAGCLAADQVAEAIRDDTLLVSVMLANNEIGAIHPVAEIGRACKARGVPLHCDATQGVGKLPVDVEELGVDLLSFTAHKIYGPKGIGALYVRRRNPHARLEPLLVGGGQEKGLRSGTVNVPGIVGLAKAVELCLAEMPEESRRLAELRNRLWAELSANLPGVSLNGPSPAVPGLRLPGNLNASFAGVDGETLQTHMKDLAVSSGAACTSSNPEPSHVLRALGLGDDLARSSLRFGLGRFNTAADVDFAVETVTAAVRQLRAWGEG
ncbi:MAG: cysteine desulfurase family protein [Pirellulales bacterium]